MTTRAKAKTEERSQERFDPFKGYGIDGSTPLRALRTELDAAAGASVSIASLAIRYDHGLAPDLHRIKVNELKNRSADDHEAKLWLLRDAANTLAEWLDIQEVDGDTLVTMKPGCQPSDLQWQGRPVHPNVEEISVLKSPFDPMLKSGIFAQNTRAKGKDDLSDLIESMRTFGWIPYHPAIVDEKGVVLVGHRRLAAAKELGIPVREEQEIVTVDLGSGDPADAERLKLALASNLGNKPLNAADRKRIAERLYGTDGWSMQRIAELLRVTHKTISLDLKDCQAPDNKRAEKRGRKKLDPTLKVGPEKPRRRAPEQDKGLQAIERLVNRGVKPSRSNVAVEAGISEASSERSLLRWEGQQEAEQNLSSHGSSVSDDPLRLVLRRHIDEALDQAPVPMTMADVSAFMETLATIIRAMEDRDLSPSAPNGSEGQAKALH
jgi:ParB-like chromosome segregation protein Spo0J